MSTSRIAFASVASALVLAAVAFVPRLAAEDTKGAPAPQKPIVQPFLDRQTWTTGATMSHDGQEGKGQEDDVRARDRRHALVQTYELDMKGPDGKPMTFHGMGVTKLSEDGKTATTWWFDDMSPEPMKLSGAITDTGVELSGDSRMGGRTTITMRKTPDGIQFEMVEGANKMTDIYRRTK